MNSERTPKSDRELWRSLATDQKVAPAVSDLDFAAWLEGRLSEDEAAPIEAAVSADPAMRQAALELADILGKPLPAASPRIAVRAQALVGFAVEKPRRNWLAPLVAIFGAGLAIERSAMAGVAVAIAAVGFLMGGGLGDSYAHQKHRERATISSANPFGADTINQLNDLFTDNG